MIFAFGTNGQKKSTDTAIVIVAIHTVLVDAVFYDAAVLMSVGADLVVTTNKIKL